MVGGGLTGSLYHQPAGSSWGVCACRQHAVSFSHRMGFQLQSSSNALSCVSPEGKPGRRSKAALFLDCACLVSAPPPFSNCLDLTFGIQGRSWRLNEAHFLWSRKGGPRKASVPRSPTTSCCVSVTPGSSRNACLSLPDQLNLTGMKLGECHPQDILWSQ